MARILYKITNLINGKCYIGQTNNFNLRMSAHKATYKSMVSKAIHKYGKENFKFEKLAIFEDYMIDDAEQKAINVFNTICPNGYNLDNGGCLQKQMSDEAKKKLSKSKTGKPSNRKGKTMSEETRQRLSQSKKGKPISQKIKDMLLNYAKNQKMSEATKKKISDARKGKKLSEGHKQKLSIAKMGRKLSEETKQKMSEAQKLAYKEGRRKCGKYLQQ